MHRYRYIIQNRDWMCTYKHNTQSGSSLILWHKYVNESYHIYECVDECTMPQIWMYTWTIESRRWMHASQKFIWMFESCHKYNRFSDIFTTLSLSHHRCVWCITQLNKCVYAFSTYVHIHRCGYNVIQKRQ